VYVHTFPLSILQLMDTKDDSIFTNMNIAAINMGVQEFLCMLTYIPLDICLGIE
jgi:hypothetical protein